MRSRIEIIDAYREAYRAAHDSNPTIELSKGFYWVNGSGGYMLEELEELTQSLIAILPEGEPPEAPLATEVNA